MPQAVLALECFRQNYNLGGQSPIAGFVPGPAVRRRRVRDGRRRVRRRAGRGGKRYHFSNRIAKCFKTEAKSCPTEYADVIPSQSKSCFSGYLFVTMIYYYSIITITINTYIICVCIYMYVCMYVYIYIYTHTYVVYNMLSLPM